MIFAPLIVFTRTPTTTGYAYSHKLNYEEPIRDDIKKTLEKHYKDIFFFDVGAYVSICTDEILRDCVVVKVIVNPKTGPNNATADHWNYYPARKQLTLTHNTVFTITDNHVVETAIESFKALERLLNSESKQKE